MRSIALLPAVLVLAAAPAAAQETIRPGERVTGQLTASDPVLDDGSHFDVWRFTGQAHHRYRVTLRSDDFDAMLVVGSATRAECGDCASDDDGGGGTNASLAFSAPADGTFEILTNSFDETEMGAYELTLEDEGMHEAHEGTGGVAAGIPIELDQPVEGELVRGDDKTHGSSYSDTYAYQGRAGERITVTLRSADFDALLEMGEFEGGECTALDSDDDGGGGTDSRMTVTIPENGTYHIHVGASGNGERGRYTLLVERGPERRVAVASPITPGETMESRLDDADALADDDSYYELWSFRGQAGETVTIRMASEAFDTYLHLGRMTDGAWQALETNDDGEDGTNSDLTFILPASGEYFIRANAFAEGQTGAYTLRVDLR